MCNCNCNSTDILIIESVIVIEFCNWTQVWCTLYMYMHTYMYCNVHTSHLHVLLHWSLNKCTCFECKYYMHTYIPTCISHLMYNYIYIYIYIHVYMYVHTCMYKHTNQFMSIIGLHFFVSRSMDPRNKMWLQVACWYHLLHVSCDFWIRQSTCICTISTYKSYAHMRYLTCKITRGH